MASAESSSSRSTARTAPYGKIFVVVLTGGIASGKTAVSDRFAQLNVPVVDTDVIARQVVQPGQPALAEVVAAFGQDILTPGGELDRRALRQLIFKEPAKRQLLESILHPAIGSAALQQIKALDAPYCILVVPLLRESGLFNWAHRVLVVDVAEEVQLQRVMQRDEIDREQAEAILRAQSSRAERLRLADDVIENSGELAQLDARVASLHRKYTQLAKKLGGNPPQD